MTVSRSICAALVFATLVAYCHDTAAADVDFLVLIVDQLSVSDIIHTDLPNLRRLLDEGAAGLMNTATAGATSPENAAVTIGAGARALGPAASAQAFDAKAPIAPIKGVSQTSEVFAQVPFDSERSDLPLATAELVYMRRTGRRTSGEIVNLSIIEILSANRASAYEPVPGSLGSALLEAGVEISYFGNADTNLPKRHMTAIFMDRWGVIPRGSVQTPVVQDADSVFGIRTDYDYLSAIIHDKLKGSTQDGADREVIAMEIGDLARLYDAHLSYSEPSVTEVRDQVLERLDALVGVALSQADNEDRVMLLVPTPPRHDIALGNTFTLLVLWAGDGSMRGVLTSATTRRKGIVANLDVAPTILGAFGIEPPESFDGNAVEAEATSDVAGLLLTQLERATATGIQRRVILRPIVGAYILAYVIALIYVILRPDVLWLQKALLTALVLMAFMPLALLLIAVFDLRGVYQALCAAVVLALAMSLVVQKASSNPVLPIAVVSLATATAITIDAYTGTNLIQNSVLGYDPMAGARFYGIGNEYMGVLVGSTLMGTTAMLDVSERSAYWWRPLAIAIYIAVLLTIALPMVGANVGGAITAAVSMPVTALLIYRERLTRRGIFFALALPVLVVGVMIVLDLYLNPGGPSHLGRSVRLIDANGIYEAIEIIKRKLQMNLKLFRYSVWSRALVVGLAAVAWLLYRPTPLIRRIKDRHRGTVKGLTGTTVAALVVLLFNDSGVVAGALVLHYAAVAILYLSVYLTPERKPATTR